MRAYLFYGTIFIVILAVFYFSWLSSPRLGLSGTLPVWLVSWADASENENLRTGVPFIFLGFLTAVLLIRNSAPINKWLFFWFSLIMLAVIAELGQLFLPLRSFDLEDIAWAAIGAAVGLICTYGLAKIVLKKDLFN